VVDQDAFATELTALRDGRGCVDVSDRRIWAVRGDDAVGWLHDLLTADIAGLVLGATCRSLLLTPTGYIRADVQVVRRIEDVLLVQGSDQPEGVGTVLASYVLSSNVELSEVTGDLVILALPGATDAPGGTNGFAPSCLGAGIDLIAETTEVPASRAALRAGGFVEVRPAAAEAWRIARGVPRMGTDFDQRSLPAEVGLDDLIDTTKGCFLGQESVARVRNLGHPPRVLRHVQGDVALATGAPVLAGGQQAVGSVTSATWIEDRSIAIVRVAWSAATARLADIDGHPLTDVAVAG
jgi:folate-binding protein YgfZ